MTPLLLFDEPAWVLWGTAILLAIGLGRVWPRVAPWLPGRRLTPTSKTITSDNEYELIKDALGELLTREDHDVRYEAMTAADKLEAGRLDFTTTELYALRMGSRLHAKWLREEGWEELADDLDAEQKALDHAWRRSRR